MCELFVLGGKLGFPSAETPCFNKTGFGLKWNSKFESENCPWFGRVSAPLLLKAGLAGSVGRSWASQALHLWQIPWIWTQKNTWDIWWNPLCSHWSNAFEFINHLPSSAPAPYHSFYFPVVTPSYEHMVEGLELCLVELLCRWGFLPSSCAEIWIFFFFFITNQDKKFQKELERWHIFWNKRACSNVGFFATRFKL